MFKYSFYILFIYLLFSCSPNNTHCTEEYQYPRTSFASDSICKLINSSYLIEYEKTLLYLKLRYFDWNCYDINRKYINSNINNNIFFIENIYLVGDSIIEFSFSYKTDSLECIYSKTKYAGFASLISKVGVSKKDKAIKYIISYAGTKEAFQVLTPKYFSERENRVKNIRENSKDTTLIYLIKKYKNDSLAFFRQ